MKRSIITFVAVLVAWCGVGAPFAAAQFGTLGQPPARPRPTVSPFINLGRGGGAMSYYGLIRPQTDATRSIMELQNVVNRMNPDGSLMGQLDQQNQVNALGGLQTGHSVTYFNYSHYYPMTPTGGTGTSSGNIGGFSPGMGGFNTTGTGFGVGGVSGPRTFFGPTFNVLPR